MEVIGLQLHTGTCMNLTNIMLTKRNKVLNIHNVRFHLCKIQNGKN